MNKKKNSNENIQVFVRCRPLLNSELNSSVPVEVYPEVNKILVREAGTDKNSVKSFTFDGVFGPDTKQAEIYSKIVAPVVQEVIQGFKCTIFAYGQTGTGKTYTVEGGRTLGLEDRSNDPLAGIIPRCMNHLFQELTAQESEFEIFVSFLELYNEQIFDLLSKYDNPIKLKMFGNCSQKGSVIVQGLETVSVKSMDAVYNILDIGCRKRKKAATLLNKASSRSHTIFTVNINVKESSSAVEKMISGKINLVDLAGSENIGRSGAIEKRAREAGNINQSLLALGRVITALCEKAGHIPYRESKLTRLLQDSLGGQTKTTVIATISASAVHIDETLNTLEYALRAKNITNKPELDAHITVNSLVQDYLKKICELEKKINKIGSVNGFYVTEETLSNWISTIQSKCEEKFRLIDQIESRKERDKFLDVAIAEENKKSTEASATLANIKLDVVELRNELEKEKKEQRLHEEMHQIMIPMSDHLHEQLHQILGVHKTLEAELRRAKETLNNTVKEHKTLREKLQEIRINRRLWSEKFRNNWDNLLSSMKNMNENLNSMSLQSTSYLDKLKNRLEERSADLEKEFGNFSKAVDNLEGINVNFQENIDALISVEKNAEMKWLEEFQEKYSASNGPNALDPLITTFNDCEASLLQISSTLIDWKKDLDLEMKNHLKTIKEQADSQKNALDSTFNIVKELLDKQKENLESCNSIVAECLSSEAAKERSWKDQFFAIEQAVSLLDIHCTTYVDNEIDKANQIHSYLKNSSKLGIEIEEKFALFSENTLKDVDSMLSQDVHLQKIFSEKYEDLKTKVTSLSSKHNEFTSELEKITDKSQNFEDDLTEVETFIENKINASKEPESLACIQTTCDSLMKLKENYQALLSADQTEIEASLLKDKLQMTMLTESSKILSNTVKAKLSHTIQCIEKDLLKTLEKNKDAEMENKTRDKSCFESTVLELDETMVSSRAANQEDADFEKECPICCSAKATDETLRAEANTPVPGSPVMSILKNSLKKSFQLCDATESKSFSSTDLSSPVRRPRNGSVSARRNLLFQGVETLTQELWESPDEESQILSR